MTAIDYLFVFAVNSIACFVGMYAYVILDMWEKLPEIKRDNPKFTDYTPVSELIMFYLRSRSQNLVLTMLTFPLIAGSFCVDFVREGLSDLWAFVIIASITGSGHVAIKKALNRSFKKGLEKVGIDGQD